MANIIIFSFPYYGHMNCLTKVAKMLAEENQVYMDMDKKYAYMLEDSNVHILETKFREEVKVEDRGVKEKLEAVFYFADGILSCTEAYFQDIERIQQLEPDCILFDSMAYWGKRVAKYLHIPYLSSITMQPFGEEDFSTDIRLILQSYIGESNITEKKLKREVSMYEIILQNKYSDAQFRIADCICARGMLNILYTVPELLFYEKVLQEKNVFLGMVLPEENQVSSIEEGKGIYISFGSILKLKTLLVTCMEGVKDLEIPIYVSAGEYAAELEERYKEYTNIKIGKFMNQLELLKTCSLCICHGGQNTVMESLYYRVPLLIIPQVNDEFVNAKFVEKRGYGQALRQSEVTPELIKQKSIEILGSEECKENTQDASRKLRTYSNTTYEEKQMKLCVAVKNLIK